MLQAGVEALRVVVHFPHHHPAQVRRALRGAFAPVVVGRRLRVRVVGGGRRGGEGKGELGRGGD